MGSQDHFDLVSGSPSWSDTRAPHAARAHGPAALQLTSSRLLRGSRNIPPNACPVSCPVAHFRASTRAQFQSMVLPLEPPPEKCAGKGLPGLPHLSVDPPDRSLWLPRSSRPTSLEVQSPSPRIMNFFRVRSGKKIENALARKRPAVRLQLHLRADPRLWLEANGHSAGFQRLPSEPNPT